MDKKYKVDIKYGLQIRRPVLYNILPKPKNKDIWVKKFGITFKIFGKKISI